jgi:hypothetical protein
MPDQEMPHCVVPGCSREGRNNLGVRLRRPDTSAIWAPNTQAYVCDLHAETGARILVFYEATETDEVEIEVRGSTSELSRVTEIRHAADPADELASQLRGRQDE